MRRTCNFIIVCACIVLIALLSGCTSTKTEKARAQAYYLNHDYVLAYDILFTLAKRGDPQAQYTLAYMYYYGQGVAKNEDTARGWMRKAAVSGNQRAKYALELMIDNRSSRYIDPNPRRPMSSSNNETMETRPSTDINWIRQQNPEEYTLVFIPTAQTKHLTDILLNQATQANRTVTYSFQHNGHLQKAFAYGTYPSSNAAQISKNGFAHKALQKELKLAQWKNVHDVMLP